MQTRGIANLSLAALAATVVYGACEAATAAPSAGEAGSAPADGVIGLVMSFQNFAIYETPDAKECPQGLNVGQNTQYLAQFPTELQRAAQEVQFGGLYGNRGPHGENVTNAPLSVEDPLP